MQSYSAVPYLQTSYLPTQMQGFLDFSTFLDLYYSFGTTAHLPG